ncbi:MAG: dicarboxylate/amino acid:cation symporter [Bacteroidaceae bacterium]|nr:dicarboxylate/amino acid:cation symporter [Bacteroidaceae bacterium]
MMKIRIPLLLRIVIAIILGILLGMCVPTACVRIMTTFNALFDQILKFLIPLIIVGLVTPAIAELGKGAGKMLGVTILFAYSFTVLSGLFSYATSVSVFPSLIDTQQFADIATTAEDPFPPFFIITIPPMMEVMTALVLAIMAGLGIAAFDAPVLRQGFKEFRNIVTKTIEKIIIPFLPVYIFGIFLKMAAEGQIAVVLATFLKIIIVIFIMTFVILILQYLLAGAVTKRNPFKLLATMMPAYFTALGTASSAATIPVTLKQTLKNRVSEEVAGFVIPLCATIHLSGSTLKITACAIAIMMINGMPFDFPLMLGFILMLGVVMVAAPGVPGGAIMASLGVLGSILGFNTEQEAMMITLYVAMDSFGTACNVTGDGSIALIIDRINRTKKETSKSET